MPSSSGPAFADEVDDRFAPPAVCELHDAGALGAIGEHRVVSATGPRQLEGCRRPVDHDHCRGGEGLERLDPDVPQAAGAKHDRVRPRVEDRRRLLHCVVGGEAGVGQGSDVFGADGRIELDDRAGAGLEELGEAPVGVDPREGAAGAVHVVARPTRSAEAAGDQGVNDHGVADRDVLDRGADGVDPSGVLVAEGVGERDVALVLPLAFDDVEIGPAQPRAADAHDHVQRPADRRVRRVLDRRPAAVGVQPYGLHRSISPSG